MIPVKNQLTLQEFLALPEGDVTYELVDGEAIPKISPKQFHSRLTGAIFTLLTQWCQNRGEVGIEWAITLTRNGQDWVPVPDLLYISYNRLPSERILDGSCPLPKTQNCWLKRRKSLFSVASTWLQSMKP